MTKVPTTPKPHSKPAAARTGGTAAVELRASQERDITAIHAIYAHHVTHGTGSYELTPPSLREMQERHATVVAHGYPFLVYESDHQILGFAYGSAFRARPGFRYTVEDSVYVAAPYCGQGIGQRLLCELMQRCEASGFRQMVAVIGDSLNRASIALHTQQGFRPAGTLCSTGWKKERWLDTVLMQRELGPGNQGPPIDLARG